MALGSRKRKGPRTAASLAPRAEPQSGGNPFSKQ
jgi:hypothetical protein